MLESPSMMSSSRRSSARPRTPLQYSSANPRGASADSLKPLLVETPPALEKTSLYLNPELSLLQFQRRVLEEARDTRNPLLERVKFLAILNSNLDEFFMVRVAGLMQQIENKVQEPGMDGRLPAETLEAIRVEVDR